MKTFLSDQRKERLMKDLLGLGMPAVMAIEAAYLPSDVQSVDLEMTWHAQRSLTLAKNIATCGTSDMSKLFELSTFLAADLIILGTFRDEANERGVMRSFVHWMEAASHLRFQ